MKPVQLQGLGRSKLRLQLTKKCFIRFYKSSLINQWSSFKHLLGSASTDWQKRFVSFDSFRSVDWTSGHLPNWFNRIRQDIHKLLLANILTQMFWFTSWTILKKCSVRWSFFQKNNQSIDCFLHKKDQCIDWFGIDIINEAWYLKQIVDMENPWWHRNWI
jgi:hypothetical protein